MAETGPEAPAKPTYEDLEAENVRLRRALAAAETKAGGKRPLEETPASGRRKPAQTVLDPAAPDRFRRPYDGR